MYDEKNPIVFTSLRESLLPEVVKLHEHAFEGYMNTKLGSRYLIHFFHWFLDYDRAIALVAINSLEKPLGYIIGAPVGYEKKLSRDLFWIALTSILLQPNLLLGENFRVAILERAKIILGKASIKRKYPVLREPIMSLVGIGVSPDAQRLGIGQGLVNKFEEKAKYLEMKSLRLSVYPHNQSARKLYENCGWQPFHDNLLSNQVMFYFKQF